MPQPYHYEECYFHAPDGLRLYFRDYRPQATGTPIVCLPGMTRNSKDFEKLAEVLMAMDRRIISPDLRGRGKSQYDAQLQNYHPGTYVQDVLKLTDELGFSKIVIIGTSLGGLMAMMIAALRPHLLEAVVLNDIGPEVAPKGLARIRSYVGKSKPMANWQDATLAFRSLNKKFFPTYTDDEWLEITHNTFKENEDGLVVADYDPAIASPFSDDEKALPPGDPWQRMEGLQNLPVLLCHGLLSDILTPAIVARMKKIKPDLKVVTVPDTGHVPLLTEPGCREAIREFLKRCPT